MQAADVFTTASRAFYLFFGRQEVIFDALQSPDRNASLCSSSNSIVRHSVQQTKKIATSLFNLAKTVVSGLLTFPNGRT